MAVASEILASRETLEQTSYRGSSPRSVELKGIAEPVEVVSVDWQ